MSAADQGSIGAAPRHDLCQGLAREMAERYWGQRGIDYHTKTLDEPRWLVRIEPVEITTWYGTWAQRYRHYDWSLSSG